MFVVAAALAVTGITDLFFLSVLTSATEKVVSGSEAEITPAALAASSNSLLGFERENTSLGRPMAGLILPMTITSLFSTACFTRKRRVILTASGYLPWISSIVKWLVGHSMTNEFFLLVLLLSFSAFLVNFVNNLNQ